MATAVKHTVFPQRIILLPGGGEKEGLKGKFGVRFTGSANGAAPVPYCL
jgi:hypothetical protein